jgi:NADPH2:quinone reductase
MRGFLVLDHFDRFPEAIGYLAGLMAEGKLTYDETIVDGLENAAGTYDQLYSGDNMGKLLVRVAEPGTDT